MSNVVNISDRKDVVDIVRERLEAEHVVICFVDKDGMIAAHISDDTTDINLVYMIQTLTDLRRIRYDV